MKLEVFENDVYRTANPELDVKDAINNCLLGLTGESGEVADLFKKVWYQGHNMSRKKVLNEIGDVLYYATLLTKLMDSSLEEVVTMNIVKRSKRYPDGFNFKASRERVDLNDKPIVLTAEKVDLDIVAFRKQWEEAMVTGKLVTTDMKIWTNDGDL